MEMPPNHARPIRVSESVRDLMIDEHIIKPPVLAYKILNKFSKVHFYSDVRECGFCLRLDLLPHAFINRVCSPEDINYICGHELAHIRLGHLDYDFKSMTFQRARVLRFEADRFRDELFMPEAWVRDVCAGGSLEYSDIPYLSQYFCVPQHAVISRLNFLGLTYSGSLQHRFRKLFHYTRSVFSFPALSVSNQNIDYRG